jgi:hypothetical protein
MRAQSLAGGGPYAHYGRRHCWLSNGSELLTRIGVEELTTL